MKSSTKHARALRGQAFDTMMLVISVIVAIAILGVLMNILGGIKIGVNDPAAVMKTDLKSIVSSGYGISQPKKVDFNKGVEVLPLSVIGDSPITEKELGFFCGTPDFCQGADSAIDVRKDMILVNKNSQAYIVVCGNDGAARSQAFKYCVGIGRQANDARDVCTKECLGK